MCISMFFCFTGFKLYISMNCQWAISKNHFIRQFWDTNLAGFSSVLSFCWFSGFLMVWKIYKCELPIENQCLLFYWAMSEDRMISQYRDMNFAGFCPFFSFCRFSQVLMVGNVFKYEMLIKNLCLLFEWAINQRYTISQSRDMNFDGFCRFFNFCWLDGFLIVWKFYKCKISMEILCLPLYWTINDNHTLSQSRIF